MIVFEFHYSDGLVTRRKFENEKEAQWFAHNEGDHLLEYFIVKTIQEEDRIVIKDAG